MIIMLLFCKLSLGDIKEKSPLSEESGAGLKLGNYFFLDLGLHDPQQRAWHFPRNDSPQIPERPTKQ